MRFLWLLITLALAHPALAAGTVRSLFVGINHYKYTESPNHDPDFKDLQGAVADVRMVKGALSAAFKDLPVDNRGGGRCGDPADFAAGGLSVTLLDDCATRVNILGAFRAVIAASRPGDKVLFYYAGHGSQIDDEAGIEYNGKNDTLVQFDARVGPGPEYHDILGVELRAIIDSAARGVKVVTIFDSCNSGKATRAMKLKPSGAAQARLAPPPAGVLAPKLPRPSANDRIGDVHLAAAADGIAANELEIPALNDHVRHGVFSYAIRKALEDAASNGGHAVSYGDIFAAASQTVTDLGFGTQQPQSAGDLNDIFLGESAVATRVVGVGPGRCGPLTLNAGTLSGVTAGSVWGLFNTSGDAGGAGAPKFTATVGAGVTNFDACLATSGPVPAGFAHAAREMSHRFALRTVTYRIAPDVTRAAEIVAALQPVDALARDDAHGAYVFAAAGVRDVQIQEASGLAVGDPISGALETDDFAAEIAKAGAKVARYHEVLALSDGASTPAPALWLASPSDCNSGPPTTNAARWPGTPYLKLPFDKDLRLCVALINTAPVKRNVYLVDFEIDRGVYLIYPGRKAQAELEPGHAVYVPNNQTLHPTSTGRSVLMLLSTSSPIDASLFEQTGVGRGAGGGGNPLEQLLRAAAGGSRGAAGAATVADWSVAKAVVDIADTAAAPSHP